MTEQEVWRDVLGFEGQYQASSAGRIRSFVRDVDGQLLRQHLRKDGYSSVQLKVAGKRATRLVHTLVDEAFNGERVGGLEVNHIDGIKSSNALSNLERVTRKQNIKHAVATGLFGDRSGESHSRAKLTKSQVLAIKSEAKPGPDGRIPRGLVQSIAANLGVSRSCIRDIAAGIRWGSVK